MIACLDVMTFFMSTFVPWVISLAFQSLCLCFRPRLNTSGGNVLLGHTLGLCSRASKPMRLRMLYMLDASQNAPAARWLKHPCLSESN